MTIAGPGTGKTQILAARIGQILLETDTRPSEILCLTFTDAGTIAMRKRLLSFIGPDAYQVAIHTFHSFCNRVIQENPDEFHKHELDPIGELEQIELLDELVKSLPRDHILIDLKSDDSYLRSGLKDFFAFLKKEDLTTEEVLRLCQKRREYIYISDEFRYKRKSGNNEAGDLKMTSIEPVEKKLRNLEAAALLFPEYRDLMLKKGYYDFDDMILWVLDLFKRKEEILLNYQEQYLYLLVDEFQDTSGSQNHLLDLLCNYWESPNVFVVGDDDQSIFRFQGAEVQNIIDFEEKYAPHGLERVMLTTNYRSTQNILDAATGLIELNTDRLVRKIPNLSKKLQSWSDENIGSNLQILDCFNPVHEAAYIAGQIERLIQEGHNAAEIAVIYRKHAQVEELASFLKNKGIPLQMRKRVNALDNDVCKLLLTTLEWIANESKKPFSADDLLFRILHEPVFEMLPVEIGMFSNWVFRFGERKSWRVLIEELKTPEKEFPYPEIRKKLLAAQEILENWITQAGSLSIQSLIDVLRRDLKILERIAQKKAYQDLESFSTFFDFVKALSQRDKNLSLQSLLERIELLNAHAIGIPQEVILYNGNGVNLLTAHASKGLEFDQVFLIGCTEKNWNGGGGRQGKFALTEIIPNSSKDGDEQENRRLFYVALTRARKNVFLGVPRSDLNGKEQGPATFVGEMTAIRPDLFSTSTVNLSDPEILEWTLNSRAENEHKGELPLNFVRETLDNYVLSVTHLNNYLRCPTAFYFGNILRVPSAKNKYLSFGTAVHRALDAVFESDINNATADTLVENYVSAMEREKSGFSRTEFERFLEYGQQILPGFFNERIPLWSQMPATKTEVMMDHIVCNGVPIKGQIDLMVINEKDVDVVDYKTGKPENGLKKLKRPTEDADAEASFEDRFGGDYWRQLVFYAILVENSPAIRVPFGTGTMDFIEPDKKEKFVRITERISRDDIEFVTEQIVSSYEKIMNMEFANGCNEPECEWCAFNEKYPHWLSKVET